ncbi:hypothetical protein [Saccharophagus degradans]|uniref:Uncharacterized protein n=2 Tax=Saccharophagus degradans TaxID=86304 RepID=Q21JT4_SACD2|nr:hypothetical protein [Saccharophagus degradans]ABD81045.1 conserved hypothetical protein [Saccharophagus degradans 2-40]MBU2984203.1 hypothetical protein [Saccharophagus degradans]MDO6424138.1 hypothetical protein [Saccharophagus degradans]MDO6608185.1 hypothetical protein [Saccharophagus degradans]WGO96714.1 hypothetical protein QFX18_11715 [Saccharophagus degradans]
MSTLYEIVEMPNGEIALKRADEVDEESGLEPLVSIRFSEESLYFLNEAKLEVAKAMIEAGLQAAGDLTDPQLVEEEAATAILEGEPTLH